MSTLVKKETKSGRVEYSTLKKTLKKEVKKSIKKRNVYNTFSRRKETLMKKANELYLSSDSEVLVQVKGPSGSRYEYKSPNFQEVESEHTEPLTIDTNLTSGEQSDIPFPSPKRTMDSEAQTTESGFFDNDKDTELCRICGEGKIKMKALWVGCTKGKCNYWVHAICIGISVKTQGPLSRMKYFCPQHRVELF